jgi:hypothetical protein
MDVETLAHVCLAAAHANLISTYGRKMPIARRIVNAAETALSIFCSRNFDLTAARGKGGRFGDASKDIQL